jgi:hypothetical protein
VFPPLPPELGVGSAMAQPPACATVSQLQPLAQSALVAHVCGTAWQLEVVAGAQSQIGGGTGSVGVGAPPSAELPPLLGAEPALEQPQSVTSAMQVKPAPQSASTVQGAS